MVRTGYQDKLKDHPSQDVEHWSERGIHKRDDRSTNLEGLFLFGQDVSCRKLAAKTGGPWV